MPIVVTNTDFLNGNLFTGQTLDNPVIFYESFYGALDISYDTNAGSTPPPNPENPPSNAWNPDTSSLWYGQGTSPGPLTLHEEYLIVDNINSATFNYMAIAGHNLSDILQDFDVSPTIIISPEISTDGIIWNPIDFGLFVQDPENNDPIVFYFDDQNAAYVRLNISCNDVTAVSAPFIAHLKVGKATPLQRREFSGVGSGYLSKHVRRTQNMSDNGQYLGQVVLSTKRQMSINQQNNTPQFVRDEIVPFIAHTEGEAQISGGSATSFFYSWRPTLYQDDVFYGWTMDNITPKHQGGDSFGGRMEWSVNMECLT